MVTTFFQAYNDSHKVPGCAMSVIAYLDQYFPQWKAELKSPDQWKDIFEFDIHIYQDSCLYDFACSLFDLIGGIEASELVWNNPQCNDYYRFAALSRLLEQDEEKYLPIYREALCKGMFNFQEDFDSVIPLFNISAKYELAMEICKAVADDNCFSKKEALKLLVSVAQKMWNDYPQDIQDIVIQKRYYALMKDCTPEFWRQLSESQKLTIVYHIILFEYKNVHDILNLHQWLHTKSIEHLTFWGYVADSYDDYCKKKKENAPDNTAFILRCFMVPSVDDKTGRYTPSGLIQHMISLTDSTKDEHLHTLLIDTVKELSGNQQ